MTGAHTPLRFSSWRHHPAWTSFAAHPTPHHTTAPLTTPTLATGPDLFQHHDITTLRLGATVAPPAVPPTPLPSASPAMAGHTSPLAVSPFDQFMVDTTKPIIPTPALRFGSAATLAPPDKQSPTDGDLTTALGQTPNEDAASRVTMYRTVEKLLTPQTRPLLKELLANGSLNDVQGDFDADTSALAELYAIATRPRVYGLNTQAILNDVVKHLTRPDMITQRFEKLTPQEMQRIITDQQAPDLNLSGEPPNPFTQYKLKDLDVQHGATCVPSSVMARVAGFNKNPKEFIRQINELTSPLQATYEKATFEEISPENPQQALDVLRLNNINFIQTGPKEVAMVLHAPEWAYTRAQAAGERDTLETRGLVESLYQSTLAYNFTGKSYGPDDLRDALDNAVVMAQGLASMTPEQKQQVMEKFNFSTSPAKLQQDLWRLIEQWPNVSPEDRQAFKQALLYRNKGLSPDQKTLMERAMQDGQSFVNVNYQIVAPKPAPKPGEETRTYLYGYTRTFEQMTDDLLKSLQRGIPVIIGVMETSNGGLDMSGIVREKGETFDGNGHEMLVTGAHTNPQTNELEFVLIDTDDNIPHARVESARTLLPRINHAGLPYDIGQPVAQQAQAMEAQGQQLVPDSSDAQRYRLIATYNPATGQLADGQHLSLKTQPLLPTQPLPTSPI